MVSKSNKCKIFDSKVLLFIAGKGPGDRQQQRIRELQEDLKYQKERVKEFEKDAKHVSLTISSLGCVHYS